MSGRPITKASTNVSTVVRIIDSTTGIPETGVTSATSGLDLRYRREGAVTVALTESDLSALTDAHSDGGMLHINSGYYRVDIPDAAFASGSDGVWIGGEATDMIVIGTYHALTDVDLYDSTRGGMTALPSANADAAGGLPISDAGGLDLDAMNTNINDIETDTNELQVDWTNGGRLDLIIDAILVDTGTTLDGKINTIDSNVDAILVDTGTTLDGKIDTIDSNVDAILVDTGTTLDGKIDTIDSNVDAILVDTGTTIPATLTTIDTVVDSILVDTGTTIPATLTTIDTVVDSILVDTAEIGAAGAGLTEAGGTGDQLTDLGGMSTVMKAEVNTEVKDVTDTDTHAEPGQGAPSATASIKDKISYIYKFMRNRITNDGTTIKVYADDETTVDQTSTVSESGGTVDRGEFGTGP